MPVSFSTTGMLFTAVRLSKRLRNHIRCCAGDNGTSTADPPSGNVTAAGRSRATNGTRVPASAWDSSRAASPATVDTSNSNRTGTWVSRVAPNRAATCVASSELPPNPKKSSSKPTGVSSPSTPAIVCATACSTIVAGARNIAAANDGTGNPRRSSFPEALSGNASSTITAAGTMYAGRRRATCARSASASTTTSPAGTT
ncbi:hypothetical protein NRB56_76400 [Nocardia sp. RB56]|uniref:Uncharacterized protein n=1 Tax=Nocardia aurantia TaxID=2585199 RepID=A0A7K0E1R0_9NOCA|nr:hypothetical protein [Nocardia aurantia]